jgi:hypothetical protein
MILKAFFGNQSGHLWVVETHHYFADKLAYVPPQNLGDKALILLLSVVLYNLITNILSIKKTKLAVGTIYGFLFSYF